ncbi:hypothetical protein AVEN_204555-1, partial [Araneus ventricosus]
MSLLVNDVNISDLWRLDTLNINDPAENQSRKELEEAAKEHFERSVKRDNEGRYIVSLPWIHDHPPLPDGRKIAERRLNSFIKALERAEKLVDYDDVFQDWQKEEEAAKDHFERSVKRDNEGRYIVSLPWIHDHPPLPDGRKIAERRLNSCIKALERAEKLVDYDDVFQDWQKEGIIEEVDPMQEIKQGQHFLPHHPVFKENSTTKVRPVFDGSAKERNTPSINDCLEKGPNLVELIPSLMNRFRVGKYGVIADIKKAFLQIGLQERDRPYLRFLWKNRGKEGNIKILQHKRVVFGISSSPFLLGATLELHLKNAPDHLKETAQQLMRSFYVDNCVFSVNTKKELARFISESQALLSTAKFELRGWEHSPTEDKIEERQEDRKVPILGLLWNLPKDTMSLDMKSLMKEDKGPTTKRKILSTVHRIFDPIGFSCPVTLEPKCLLQECWKLGLSWDAELPLLMTERFERWKMKLPKLNALEIPRCVREDFAEDSKFSIHVFCDVSQSAYATCIFLRAESADNTSCQLIQARNRVAPLKKISIPRLELLSCIIGARLAKATISELGLEKISIFYWSDSMNALYWIKRNENWATFVYNRVLKIRKLTNPEDWRHISGTLNPADLPSRGSNAEELVKSLWWEGPNCLRMPIEDCPVSETIPDFDVVNSEKRKSIVSVTNTTTEQLEYFSKVSSFRKMTRITAWIFRFYKNAKTQKKERKGCTLDLEEVEAAEKFILKQVQSQCFSGNEKLNLQTFLDSDGGFWERLIGMLKSILRKVLGKASLQFEELCTVLCDVEGIINSRPLTYLNEDNEDLVALTPAMFLQDVKEIGVPDIDQIDAKRMNKRFFYRQKLCQDLRKRFRIEYLGHLREFSKICNESKIKEGDIVLISDSNVKRINWPLGRVIKLYLGKDKKVRLVEIQTKSGSF